MFRQIGVAMLLVGSATFGWATPASAAGTCQVNTGKCDAGTCDYNAGWCNGGTCTVNYGYCGPGCNSAVNTGVCGTYPGSEDPRGRKCGFDSNTDPTPEAPDDTQTGVIYVGPLVGTGTVKCTIQVGGAGVHSDPDSTAFITATDNTVPGVIVGAGNVSYVSPSQVPVYLCTQYTENGVTTYWNGYFWSTDPNSPCGQAISVGTDDPIFDPFWETLDTAGRTVDTVICPVLVAAAGNYGDVVTIGPDGDVYVDGEYVWDCPPYTPVT